MDEAPARVLWLSVLALTCQLRRAKADMPAPWGGNFTFCPRAHCFLWA